jgi:hypothetical protein
MKKILSLFIIGALCASTLYADGYTPMTAYTRTANTTVDLSEMTGFTDFNLTAGRITANGIPQYLSVTENSRLWKTGGETQNTDTVATFPIGFDFPYGGDTFSKFVLTSEGTVFLCKSDTLITQWYFEINNTSIANALNVALRTNSTMTNSGFNAIAPVLRADGSSSIGYKTSDDILYLRFKDILLGTAAIGTKDSGVVARATYTIVLNKNGNIAVNLEKMPTVTWGQFDPIFGLRIVFKSTGDRVFLKSWDDLTFTTSASYYAIQNFPMYDNKFKPNIQINIERPAECVAPQNVSAELAENAVISHNVLKGDAGVMGVLDGAVAIV